MNRRTTVFLKRLLLLVRCITTLCLLFFIILLRPAYGQEGSASTDTQSTQDQAKPDKKKKDKKKDKAKPQGGQASDTEAAPAAGNAGNHKDSVASGTGQAKPAKSAPESGNIQFADLVAPADKKQPKLPYGQPFTITGKLSDVCVIGKAQLTGDKISCGDGGKPVTAILAAITVGGKYVVAGQEIAFTASQISGDSWSVTVAKLDENTPVTFKFIFSGKLSQNQAPMLVDKLLTSTELTTAAQRFQEAAGNRPAAEQAALVTVFGQVAAQKVLDLIAELHVTPTNADDFRRRLSAPTTEGAGLVFNLGRQLIVLRGLSPEDKQALGFRDEMTPSAAYKAISEKLTANAITGALKITAERFTAAFEALSNHLAIDVAANLSVDVGTTADGITEDLQKYAGFDIGALYVPRLHELRTFATVNIYFGPVSLHPAKGTRSWYMDRWSLTFGMALKDVSGGDPAKSKIKDQNAFVYGFGFRLNKYFRITTGGLVYRAQLPAIGGVASPITNKLRHEFFIGPSIDVTAIPALKGIFAKAKSN